MSKLTKELEANAGVPRRAVRSISAWTGRTAVLSLTMAALAACGARPEGLSGWSGIEEAARYDRVLSVKVNGTDSKAAVEAQYGGTVVSWHPEIGFATLGLTALEAGRVRAMSDDASAEVIALEPNLGVMEAASGVWGGSTGVWGGSTGVWGGGLGVWGGGSFASAPENATLWAKVRLEQARAVAPRLGTGVTVAVIDSGLDLAHPAFEGRLAPAADMYDYVGGDASPQEVGTSTDKGYGHGTVVAGIVAQVAPNAKILPLRVLRPDSSGDVTSVAAAIDRAVLKGAKVINLSLGSTARATAVANSIAAATAAGVLVVSSSGNTANTALTYPAADAAADSTTAGKLSLGVGSLTAADVKSAFSTYGTNLELVAPGEQVYGPYPGSKRAGWSGTSMAAPMASGGLALALGQTLKVPSNQLAVYLEDKVTTTIYNNSLNSAYAGKLGKGLLNLEQFLKNTVVY